MFVMTSGGTGRGGRPMFTRTRRQCTATGRETASEPRHRSPGSVASAFVPSDPAPEDTRTAGATSRHRGAVGRHEQRLGADGQGESRTAVKTLLFDVYKASHPDLRSPSGPCTGVPGPPVQNADSRSAYKSRKPSSGRVEPSAPRNGRLATRSAPEGKPERAGDLSIAPRSPRPRRRTQPDDWVPR